VSLPWLESFLSATTTAECTPRQILYRVPLKEESFSVRRHLVRAASPFARVALD